MRERAVFSWLSSIKTKGFSKTEGCNKKGQVALALEQGSAAKREPSVRRDSVAAAWSAAVAAVIFLGVEKGARGGRNQHDHRGAHDPGEIPGGVVADDHADDNRNQRDGHEEHEIKKVFHDEILAQ
ncbi:hypothetical protein THICB1_110434 [Thiomonas arsenitoxydans]|uniref:Uncharacterized protein n=1 Tax=Thiomonas arsenitoxydans (strain DSM 22701 / CIP 110005 / 3As) TaxID=426114 RepID=A0ABM9T227_THIA3|nr:hypothetical protein ACO7_10107 [Thiomonas arsenitoxydans]CQR28390.1 hypothetical protein ACO3_10107 [Thiomonas arsenitoxydans]CQR28502.1 hypothetical protein THICB1_110434 [Thiomonas arsenitoxydans]CQR30919.1 hypothetical protein THICB6_150497 [Thiomonas arsenitoxydans]